MRIFRSAWVLPVSSPPIHDGAVVVDEAEIVAVGPARDILADYGNRSAASPMKGWGIGTNTSQNGPVTSQKKPVTDLGEALLLPAFANAHTHLELSWMANSPPPQRDLIGWIRAMIVRRTPPADQVEVTIRNAIGQLRACGTALIGDVGNTTASLGPLESSGLHGCFFLELVRRRPENADPVSEGEVRLAAFADPLRIKASLVPHSPTTGALTPGLLAEIGDRARRRGDGISVHVAESRADVELLSHGGGPLRALMEEIGAIGPDWRPPGRSPVQLLDEAALLGPRTLAVHGVHLTRDDARLLAERGTTLVLCPRSNAWIGVGEAPIAMFLEENVRLAVGTDSLASNEDLDLLAELAALHRLAPRVSPSVLLRAATLGGAEGLGLGGLFGSLEPGKRAALIAIKRRAPRSAVDGRGGADHERSSEPPSEPQRSDSVSVAREAREGSDPGCEDPGSEPWRTLFAGPRQVTATALGS